MRYLLLILALSACDVDITAPAPEPTPTEPVVDEEKVAITRQYCAPKMGVNARSQGGSFHWNYQEPPLITLDILAESLTDQGYVEGTDFTLAVESSGRYNVTGVFISDILATYEGVCYPK